ncbi:MAG: TonB-dependent receptor [Gemmatimonadaceae bacterium]|nr:TonB-dependent receptor [Gemmatimonadaceae bacterium]
MPFVPARRFAARLAVSIGAVTALAAIAHATPARVPDTPPIVGVVRDSAGTPLPNVQVVVTGLDRSTSTNHQGMFLFRGLPPGRYHLTTLFLGFAPGHADVVVPAAGDTVRVTIVVHPTVLTLGGIQVTATPVGTDPRNVTQSATEVSGQALARAMAPTIAQTLAREPGVSMRFNGPAATAPVIRGLQGERILVLQDGNRAGDLSSSAPDHGVSVDPLTAQRIEVVRGPASLLYGNSALGGVVNVISNDIPSTIPLHVDGYVGTQLESVTPGGGVSGGVQVPITSGLALVGRGGIRRAEDLRQGGRERLGNSYYRNAYGTGGLALAGSKANGGVVYRRYGFDYGLPSADGDGAHIEGTRHELVGRAELAAPAGVVQSLRASGTAQWYSHDEVARTGTVNTRFNLRTQTGDVLVRTLVGAVNGALGVSGLFRQYEPTGDEALTPPVNSTGVGAFFYEEVPLASLTHPDDRVARLQFGGRYDSYRITSSGSGSPKFGPGVHRDFRAASGSVGLSVPVTERMSLAVSAARAFRAPSVEELFSNAFHEAAGTFDRGNVALEEEVNTGVEGILRFHTRRINGQLSAFGSRIANYISPNIVKDTLISGEAGPERVPLNRFSQGDAVLRGLEGQIEMEVVRHLVVGAMGDLVRGELRAAREPLPFMPPARLGGTARWDNGRWAFGGDLRHGFSQRRVPVSASDSDPSGRTTDAFTLVNVSAGLTLPLGHRVHAFTVRVDNVGDVRYRDATSRIKTFALNPGRNVSLGYRVLF